MIIFTDGASSGNPGPGGWGVILVGATVRELGGGVKHSTNNQMELLAAIRALENIHQATDLTLYTDSTYVVQGMTQWSRTWEKNHWIASTGKPVANILLWKQLICVAQPHTIHWRHVRGHTGVPGNERTDQIAVAFSKGLSVALYEGSADRYPIDILSGIKK